MELKISLNPIDIKQLEQKYINNNLPDISVGDTVKIGVLITEGNKERVQFSEGELGTCCSFWRRGTLLVFLNLQSNH